MQRLNLVVVFHPTEEKVLVCHRQKDPYKGLYNFVGGKVEQGETPETAAYRELWEETGITSEEISLVHMADFRYPISQCVLEIFVGRLSVDKHVFGEENPLLWMSTEQNFFDCTKFAGEGNMGHILELVKQYGTAVLSQP